MFLTKKEKIGDTYAIKINDIKSELYNRYFIFIRTSYSETKVNEYTYRIKITDKELLPKSQEELNSLEYVITKYIPEELKYLPIDGFISYKDWVEKQKNLISKPDEYGYLYMYITKIFKMPSCLKNIDVIYLGNFDIEPPKDEFLPLSIHMLKGLLFDEDIIKSLCEGYLGYNKKREYIYTKDGNKQIKESAKRDINIQIENDNSIDIIMNKPYKISDYKSFEKILEEKVINLYNELSLMYNNNKLIDVMYREAKNFLEDMYDEDLFWIFLAKLQKKNNKLDNKLKSKVNLCIEKHKLFWSLSPIYEERMNEIDKIKENLINS